MTSATPGPQPDDLIRRLRAWPVSSWTAERRAAARATMHQLVALSAAPAQPLPELAVTSYPDQLAVLYREAALYREAVLDGDAVLDGEAVLDREARAGAGGTNPPAAAAAAADGLLADLAARLGWC